MASPILQAYPDASIDLLTYQSNVGILEGVEGDNKIIVVEQMPSKWQLMKELWSLRGHYDWVITARVNVRSVLFAYVTARFQVMHHSEHRW